ncbi:MAG: hypothetical protein QOG46_2012 [Pseudonocardiales bacterium]|nr:hypothetical protein [Pseudonocardiales bacterium]
MSNRWPDGGEPDDHRRDCAVGGRGLLELAGLAFVVLEPRRPRILSELPDESTGLPRGSRISLTERRGRCRARTRSTHGRAGCLAVRMDRRAPQGVEGQPAARDRRCP